MVNVRIASNILFTPEGYIHNIFTEVFTRLPSRNRKLIRRNQSEENYNSKKGPGNNMFYRQAPFKYLEQTQ